MGGDCAAGWSVNARHDFQHGGFARAVVTDQPVDTALRDFNGNVLERPEILAFFRASSNESFLECVALIGEAHEAFTNVVGVNC